MATAIILAGGLGTRLREVVPELPKPMAPINGRPFLALQIDYWIGQGIDRFVLSVGYCADTIRSYFGAAYRGRRLDYAEERSPLGTGGGLLTALKGIDERVVVLNGDTFFALSYPKLLDFHVAHNARLTMALHRRIDVDRYLGVELDSSDRISALTSSSMSGGGLVNGGVYLIEPSSLREFGLQSGERYSLESEILPRYIGMASQIYGMECPGTFIDIGTPTDYHRAHDLLAGRSGTKSTLSGR
ncbi:MAG TPA: sugar phosphate nucleotidyltransferase [Acidiphilium sp.]|uniref:sugar phosphate nucleotidyltransferase n=1 Tax=unclassified Acidiphilium TaxID=2617493 RepID=UPI000BD7A153|nr:MULTISPECIES: sugar phosphate nucleotidyltransferase [unclassified Acidiphilium]OYV51210.1 MAG: hypothetical protein B7X10_00875 [Burkholderiales bacterium 21-58-4]OZB25974.1 MAG: hypothetical protein B7X49_13050 [Acidiphilium sp. 34-64-41]HQT90271.1 sugar phosphate nucleotidyltransferase [Acidiphilium sp.]